MQIADMNNLTQQKDTVDHSISISFHMHIFVYKMLTKCNEIQCVSKNYDKEIKIQIINRQ